MIWRGTRRRRASVALAGFLFAASGVIAPWIVRNWVVLGDPALTSGYAQLALAQRVAYDEMSWRQYALFNLCSLPDGSGLGSLLVKPNACAIFGYDFVPGHFYDIGSTSLLKNTAAAAGGTKTQIHYIIRSYIVDQPIWHTLVSIPFAIKGLCIDHYWGLIMGLLCIPLTLRALRRFDLPMLAATLPSWFMLAFYASLSADQTRYNLMLIIPFSLAGGSAIARLLPKRGRAVPDRMNSSDRATTRAKADQMAASDWTTL